jgi:predicted unusual protein kinase regulating ubiquinone biosynthesis (AarF/ABC1/UbiB family)
MASERRVNGSRLGRLSQLGRLAGGLAGGMLSEGARRVAQGERPTMSGMLLTPANARRVADRLSEMRGAAMKVGQLLSMDSGEVLPRELSEVLEKLRENAHYMPLGQVNQVLRDAWGEGWEGQFRQFAFTPLAAASIGQVHDATLKDGRRLAVKVQYPGVRQSIDSDVHNVATLLRLFRLVPESLEVMPFLEEAKRQLHAESDYRAEATAMRRFADRLGDDPRYLVPQCVDELSNADVLAMSFLDGQAIERAADLPSAQRNDIAANLTALALREVYAWGLVQTDPNFANYLFEPASRRIHLLDFGATRSYSDAMRDGLRELLGACADGADADVAKAAVRIGYLEDGDSPAYRDNIVKLLRTATEPARHVGDYRFGASDLAQRMGDIVVQVRLRDQQGRLPPADILFLHRKLGGLYLLLARLRAVLPVRDLVSEVLAVPPHADEGDLSLAS